MASNQASIYFFVHPVIEVTDGQRPEVRRSRQEPALEMKLWRDTEF